MDALLKVAGGILLGLAVLHAFFPTYFKWKDELSTITPLTRQIHYIHTFFIALTVLLNGLLYLTCTTDLLTTPLGHRISLGFFIFWACRLILQFFGYSSSLWRGKPFETVMHFLFSLLWFFLTAVFGLAAFGHLKAE
jgi:hypothetical protein